MSIQTEYSNWWSKLLFKKKFENQFYIASPQPLLERALLGAMERWGFNSDYKKIPIEKPIFIVGLPRSGTTLLYNLIAFHENGTYVTNSMNNAFHQLRAVESLRKKLKLDVKGERFFKDSIETDLGSPSEPIMLWGKWFDRDPHTLYWESLTRGQLGEDRIAEVYDDIRKIISTFNRSHPRFVCKYPVMQPDLALLQDLFPDAKFIHIVRDPREVANSLVKLHRMSNDQLKKINHPLLKEIVPYPRVKNLENLLNTYGADNLICTSHIWNESIELVDSQRKQLNHFLEVRYEDLLEMPETFMSELFEFCELSTPSPTNKRYQDEFSKIGKTHHKNSYKSYDLISSICQPLMERFNYLEK